MNEQAKVQLPLYKCHKEVRAAKIAAILEPVDGIGPALSLEGGGLLFVVQPWLDKHKPDLGGYYVASEDGSETYMPWQDFEGDHTLIDGPAWRLQARRIDSEEVEGSITEMEASSLAKTGEVTVREARLIAFRYNASHFRARDLGEQARYTIPVDFRRDDDVRLHAFISRASLAFGELAKLKSDAGATPGTAQLTDRQLYEFFLVIAKLDDAEDAEAPPSFDEFVAEAADGLAVFKAAISDALAAMGFTTPVASADAERETLAHKASEQNRIIRELQARGLYTEDIGAIVRAEVDHA